MTTLVRAKIAHTPGNFGALEAFEDGGLAFASGRIVACGPYSRVAERCPDAVTLDARHAILLPGFVDCHVHYPQLRVIGALGLDLMDWLRRAAFPEELRLADRAYAESVAAEFVRALAAHGTTTALVFGSHFPAAQDALFAAAESSGLRVCSGLVVSDRGVPSGLSTSVEDALAFSRELIDRWHGRGLARYAVTPRFAASCSEAMLEACGELGRLPGEPLITSHLNESPSEIALVHDLFPQDADYVAIYERFGLVGARSVFAHDVHASDSELARLAATGAAVAHCASSNAVLGSGLFPLRRHLDAGVRVGLGTDVGAGAGFSMLGAALTAYELQRLGPSPFALRGPELLHLVTAAGAAALGLHDEVGDLRPGKSADFVLVRPGAGSVLEAVLERCDSVEEMLGPLFTLARAESIAEVRVAGRTVWPSISEAEVD